MGLVSRGSWLNFGGAALASFVVLGLSPYVLEEVLGVSGEWAVLMMFALGLLLVFPERTRRVGAGVLVGALAYLAAAAIVLSAALPE